MIWLAREMRRTLAGRGAAGAVAGCRRSAAGDRDDFLYAGDPDGMACPLGAHIRRTNPRDVIKPYTAAQSLSMSEAHRLLRRARSVRAGVVRSSGAHRSRESGRPAGHARPRERRSGARHPFLLRQRQHPKPVRVRAADLVQQPSFRRPQRQQGSDPRRQRPARRDAKPMTVPQRPFRLRTSALPRFVTVRAGAYLFMPSLTALRFLSCVSGQLTVRDYNRGVLLRTDRAARACYRTDGGQIVYGVPGLGRPCPLAPRMSPSVLRHRAARSHAGHLPRRRADHRGRVGRRQGHPPRSQGHEPAARVRWRHRVGRGRHDLAPGRRGAAAARARLHERAAQHALDRRRHARRRRHRRQLAAPRLRGGSGGRAGGRHADRRRSSA